jgi:pyruvate kinase
VVAELAEDLHVAAIVTLTQSGATALAVSRFRPESPIVAATPFAHVVRRLSIVWGIHALQVPFAEDSRALLDSVTTAIRVAGFAESGQRVAITAGLGTRIAGGTDFVHVRTV